MEPQRAPQNARRAKSHGGLIACVALAAALAFAAGALSACGETKGETDPDPGSASESGGAGKSDAAQAAGGRAPRDGDLPPELHPLETSVPIYGDRRLSRDAIEIKPYELMPRDLPITEADRQQIVKLLRALQELDPTLTSDHHDKWFIQNKRLVQELEMSTRPEIGWAALHAFSHYPERHFPIRRTLLAIGARVSPKEAEPMLAELAFNYDYYIEDRSEALLLLAETSPAVFFEGARPYIERQGKPFQTAPNDEFFVRGWLTACEQSGESPVEMMAQVATNLALEPYARVVAVRALGKHADDPRASGAIQTTLVESTGNGYLRRISAQTVMDGFPRETACALLQAVMNRDSDLNFARFLDDMIQLNCR